MPEELNAKQKIAVLLAILVWALMFILIIGTFATTQSGKPDYCGPGTALVQTNRGDGGTSNDELMCVPLEAK